MWSLRDFCNRLSKSSIFKFNRIFHSSSWESFEKINMIIKSNVILFLLKSSIFFSAFWDPRLIIVKNICLESNSEARFCSEFKNFENSEGSTIIHFNKVFIIISFHSHSFSRFLIYFRSRFRFLARSFTRSFIHVIFYSISLFRWIKYVFICSNLNDSRCVNLSNFNFVRIKSSRESIKRSFIRTTTGSYTVKSESINYWKSFISIEEFRILKTIGFLYRQWEYIFSIEIISASSFILAFIL